MNPTGGIEQEGLTFDDVLLVPRRSGIKPRDVEVRTQLTRNIALDIPLLSAAMDTVTESEMAIALAREGGIGVIHRNMPLERQAEEVDRVKRSESGMIENPITLTADRVIGEAAGLMRKFSISGVPIVDRQGMLVGIITNRDLIFEKEMTRKIEDVMTKKNLITAPVGTTLEKAEEILRGHKIEKLPVVDDEGKLRGLITIKDIIKKRRYPQASKDDLGRLRVAAAVGVTGNWEARARALLEARVDCIVIDSAHGHSDDVIAATKRLRRLSTDADIIAGNVATVEGARDLLDLEIDGLKVGIGPSAICTTRVVAGAGVPQLTAIVECSRVAAERDTPLIADGGIKYSGDIVKALAAGASTVMIGSLFAGTEESPGERFLFEGRTFKVYRGMGSLDAMREGGADRYMQEGTDQAKFVPEGIVGRVPYRGPVSDTVFQLVGGLKSGMGYCGARTIEELQKTARFMRITGASLRESHPHDITITREAPNYEIPR
jgi:IMP dehydrogenase